MKRLTSAVLSYFLAATVANAQILLLGAGNNGGGVVGYMQPPLTNNYLIGYGDSRTANAGGVLYTGGSTVTSNIGFGATYFGQVYALSGNKYLPEYGYNYGIGAQTSAGIAARVNNTTNYCDDPTSSSLACFQGLSATTGTALAVSSSPQVISLSGFGGTINPSENYVVQVNAYLGTDCVVSGAALTTTSVTLPGNCVNGAGTSGQAISFTPTTISAQANPFWNFLNSTGTNANSVPYGSGTDISPNKSGGGASWNSSSLTSPATDPAVVDFILAGTNDGNLGAVQTASNLASMFNALGPYGSGTPNKIIVAADEIPRGAATGWSNSTTGNNTDNGDPETWAIPSSPVACGSTYTSNYCVTVAKTASFISEPGLSTPQTPLPVYYAPAGTLAVPFVAGANDGVALTYCGSLGCSPGTGQFGVDATGHYAFNAADAGKKVAIWYRWANQPSGPFMNGIHDWLSSNNCAPSWSDGTYTFQNAGAKCPTGYPWVHVASTWASILDTNSGTTYLPAPFTLYDGLHPTPYGGFVVANAMLSAASAAGVVPASAPYTPPTVSNWDINASTQTSTSAQTTTCPANSVGAASLTQKYFLSGVALGGVALASVSSTVANSLLNAPLYFPNSTSGVPAGTTITCVDRTNSVLQLSAPATVIQSYTTTWIVAKLDATSLVGDGVLSYAYGTYGPAVTGCGTYSSGYPSCPAPVVSGWTIKNALPVGWTMALDAASQTAIAAGTLGVSVGVCSACAPDGYDALVIQLQGYAGTTAAKITLTDSLVSQMAASFLVSGTTNIRGICRVLTGKGPNGHLTGTSGVQVVAALNQTAFTPPGAAAFSATTGYNFANNNYIASSTSSGGGAIAFSDPIATSTAPNAVAVTGAPGGYMQQLDQLTPPLKLTTSYTSETISGTIAWNAKDPISATILIERCGYDVAAQ